MVTDSNANTADMLLPRGAPTMATSNYEAGTTSLSFITTKRGRRISNDNDAMVFSLQHEPIKRRRLDLGDLMVKTTGPAKPISDKPAAQFRTIRSPEITRLAENDPMPPPPANKSIGRRSGKDGRPTVSGLIQAR